MSSELIAVKSVLFFGGSYVTELVICLRGTLWSWNPRASIIIDDEEFGFPHGHRGTVLMMLLEHFQFRIRRINEFYTEVDPALAKLIKGLCRLTGPSRITKNKLKQLEEMSLEDLVEWLRVYVLSRAIKRACY